MKNFTEQNNRELSRYDYSVLMAVYHKDNPLYLRVAIESMLNQTAPPEQFVIVEDGPLTDCLDEVILNFSTDFPKLFTIVKLKENNGLGNALNNGLKVCRNELIARMDADDISKPDRCEKQLERFSANPNINILGTQIEEFINSTDNVVSKRVVPCTFDEIIRFAKRRSPFNHPTVMYRKSSLNESGGYSQYSRKEDLDLFVRMVSQGYYVENLAESLLWYRTSEDNLQRRKSWRNCREYIEIMAKYYKRGFLGFKDIVYVFLGQIFLFISPAILVDSITIRLLRN